MKTNEDKEESCFRVDCCSGQFVREIFTALCKNGHRIHFYHECPICLNSKKEANFLSCWAD